jgi:hypothetical protein
VTFCEGSTAGAINDEAASPRAQLSDAKSNPPGSSVTKGGWRLQLADNRPAHRTNPHFHFSIAVNPGGGRSVLRSGGRGTGVDSGWGSEETTVPLSDEEAATYLRELNNLYVNANYTALAYYEAAASANRWGRVMAFVPAILAAAADVMSAAGLSRTWNALRRGRLDVRYGDIPGVIPARGGATYGRSSPTGPRQRVPVTGATQ